MRFDYHVFVMTVGFAHYVWSNITLHISPANTMCEYYLALKHKRCIQHNKLSFLETPRLRQNLSEYYFSKKKRNLAHFFLSHNARSTIAATHPALSFEWIVVKGSDSPRNMFTSWPQKCIIYLIFLFVMSGSHIFLYFSLAKHTCFQFFPC